MFRRFAGIIPEGALAMFKCHPAVLTTLLETAWEVRSHDNSQPSQPGQPATLPLGHPGHRSDIFSLPPFWLKKLQDAARIVAPDGSAAIWPAKVPEGTVLWDHLIYAYMIENTRIYEIFRRVLYEFLHGEKLGVPTADAQHWLRNTEELFYRDAPPFSITTITSHIRSDLRASRRNAYWRMFGMDLNHGVDEGQPYPYIKADAYNNEFVFTFEELLREVWIAIINFGNTSGANPTDQGKIQNLVTMLQNMLLSRRVNGNLSREEFVFVSMMSWFHLTVSFDSPIIQALRAEASGPEQRLFKVAQRVGLPAHGLSKSFFDIADPISRILIHIEAVGTGVVADLVATAISSPTHALTSLQTDMNTVMTYWNSITGHDVKAGKVVVR